MNSEGVPGLDWHRGSPHGLLTRPLTVTRKRSLLIRTLILIGAQSVVSRSSSLTRRLLICASWFCLHLSIKVLPWPCHFYFECWKASPGTSGGNFFAKLGSLKLKLPKLFTLFKKKYSQMPEKIVTVSEPHQTKLEVKEFPTQTCMTYMTNLKL